jgi:bacterioferritin
LKGNKKVIQTLNALLADELTAINQYMVHSEMCANWGYERLHESVEKRAVTEMKHAEKLIARVLFLEGTPLVSKLNEIQKRFGGGANGCKGLQRGHPAGC